LWFVDEKGDVKAANGRLVSTLQAALGSTLIEEALRINGPSAQKLRAQFPEIGL
jgi:hypothetical protein